VFYADLTLSSALGWGALLACMRAGDGPVRLACFVLAVLALYRAASFIHELTHLRPGAVPGFDWLWNALVGIPLLLPSLLYEGGVHGLHHAKTYYGTARDPEYLPIASWPAWKVVGWVLHAAALPVALALRFLVLAPLSVLHPRLRAWVWAHASSLSVNPAFLRAPPPPEHRARFAAQEALCFAWAAALVALVATGAVAARSLLVAAVAAAAVGVLNQLRTAVAHRWRNEEGRALSFEEQFLDSVNVVGPAGALWAPVGLRFHALHHLLPGLPYHALGAAHRRVTSALPGDAPYRRATEPSLTAALGALARELPRR